MTISYTVAVQYDDTTDVLDIDHDDINQALALRDTIVRHHATDPWDGLRYVYVIANGRVMV